MCIVSNWVNEAQDLIAVKKYDDLPNSLIPIRYIDNTRLTDSCIEVSSITSTPCLGTQVQGVLDRGPDAGRVLLLLGGRGGGQARHGGQGGAARRVLPHQQRPLQVNGDHY